MARVGPWWCALVASVVLACTPMYRRELGTPTVQPDGSIGPESGELRKARKFAVKHLGCPAQKVSVQQVNDVMFQAGGCGRTATIFCEKGRKGLCEAHDDEPSAAPAPSAAATVETNPFDVEVARSSLKSVTYADCGIGGVGKIQITIEPSGKTSTVNVVEGTYDESTTRCLFTRFSKVSVPPFTGAPRVLRWTISLPED
jgi:hypothetical protein